MLKKRNVSPFTPHDVAAMVRIRAQLATRTLLDIAQFWRDVESVSIPLSIEAHGENDERDITFLWRTGKLLHGVYVRLNRVTDKDDVVKGLMTHIPSSDIWTLTLRLHSTYRGSYTIIEIPQGTSPEIVSQLGGRFSPIVGKADPFNKTSVINVRGVEESILALEHSPEQREWEGVSGAYAGVIATSYPFVAGNQRRVRLYIPDVSRSTPLGLLVLLDAETWFDHVGVLGAIDIAINNGRISPLAVLGIDNLNEFDRSAILGGNNELVLDIAERLVPQLRSDYSDRTWAGRSNTVLAGQSLGGVTALMAALYAPGIFGSVLCHSPSIWWKPDKNTRPSVFTENETSWLSEHVLSRPPKEVRIRLCVGSLEGVTVPHVQQLHQRLLATGVKSDLSIYTGGHDYAWWRGALIDGLTEL
ncbi:alpha/beta hydrolase-fold protein [Serratia fonticola]|uniref:alpha/beta hydrolase-fold protein n=1 Tax=Serratia fonticola TaxID=47917 RepID=UPI0015C63243|nr:alpha/beta hydrolase-fold protein [Serratia fonticola]NYA46507.1 esterase family protein [Serratia fonticola]